MGFHLRHQAVHADPAALRSWIAQQPGVVLLEFAEEDSAPCRMEEPVLRSLLRRFPGHLHVVQTDTEHDAATAAAFGVNSVPTFLVYRGGAERTRLVGFKTLTELAEAVAEAEAVAGTEAAEAPTGSRSTDS
jgi:thioredoxin 1